MSYLHINEAKIMAEYSKGGADSRKANSNYARRWRAGKTGRKNKDNRTYAFSKSGKSKFETDETGKKIGSSKGGRSYSTVNKKWRRQT